MDGITAATDPPLRDVAVVQYPHRVFVLLSTYNGAPYLAAQLESIAEQTHKDWVVYWRDDGSTDATVAILEHFAVTDGGNRCVRVLGPPGRILPGPSFIALLEAAAAAIDPDDIVAFADQDDIWLPDKLTRGIAALATVDSGDPTLYCARLMMVNAQLQQIHETHTFEGNFRFPTSLTQNIATGCTIMLNRSAVALVARGAPPKPVWHDWWCYVLVTAAGGQVLLDHAVVALYRQHNSNFVGMRSTQLQRAIAALRRGPAPFMGTLRLHLEALLSRPDLLSGDALPVALQLHRALQGGLGPRLRALRIAGLRRQNKLETMLFRLWFLIS